MITNEAEYEQARNNGDTRVMYEELHMRMWAYWAEVEPDLPRRAVVPMNGYFEN